MRPGLPADDVWRADLMEAILLAAGHSVLKLVGAAAMRTDLRRDSVDPLLFDASNGSSGLDMLILTQRHLDPCPPMSVVAGSACAAMVASRRRGRLCDRAVLFLDSMLVAKVDVVLSRTHVRRPDAVETYAPYRFDTCTRSINRHDVAIPATAEEFALSLLLFRNLRYCLSRGHLVEEVWGQAARPRAQPRRACLPHAAAASAYSGVSAHRRVWLRLSA